MWRVFERFCNSTVKKRMPAVQTTTRLKKMCQDFLALFLSNMNRFQLKLLVAGWHSNSYYCNLPNSEILELSSTNPNSSTKFSLVNPLSSLHWLKVNNVSNINSTLYIMFSLAVNILCLENLTIIPSQHSLLICRHCQSIHNTLLYYK